MCFFVLQSKVFSRTIPTQYIYSLQPVYVASLRKGLFLFLFCKKLLLATGKGCNAHGRSHRNQSRFPGLEMTVSGCFRGGNEIYRDKN